MHCIYRQKWYLDTLIHNFCNDWQYIYIPYNLLNNTINKSRYKIIVASILIITISSVLTSQTTFATKNPVELPKGIWHMDGNGQPLQLKITNISPDNQISGTLTAFGGG